MEIKDILHKSQS